MRLTNRGSSSGKRARCRWGDRACPMTRQPPRSETPSRVQTWCPAWRLRAGLSSFPRPPLCGSRCPGGPGRPPASSVAGSLTQVPSTAWPGPAPSRRTPSASGSTSARGYPVSRRPGACAAPGQALPRPDGASCRPILCCRASLASCLLIVAPESSRSGWNGFRGQGQAPGTSCSLFVGLAAAASTPQRKSPSRLSQRAALHQVG